MLFRRKKPLNLAVSGLPDFKVRRYLSFSEGRRMNLATFYKALPPKGNYSIPEEIPISKVIMLRKLPEDWTIMEYIEAYRIMTDLGYKAIMKKNITEIFIMCNFVLKSLAYIAEKEEALSGKADAKQVQAGIEELYKFGDLTMLKDVADYCNETIHEAEKEPWGLVFSITYYNNTYAKFNKKYMDIITKAK